MLKRSLLAVLFVFTISCCLAPSLASAASPKLIVQITIDQLRGDMLPRFKARFGDTGFRYLIDKGVYYTNAHY